MPPELEQVIMRSLAKDPAARQQSMLELRNDINDAVLPGSRRSIGTNGFPASTNKPEYSPKGADAAAALAAEQQQQQQQQSKTIDVSKGQAFKDFGKDNNDTHKQKFALRQAEAIVQDQSTERKDTSNNKSVILMASIAVVLAGASLLVQLLPKTPQTTTPPAVMSTTSKSGADSSSTPAPPTAKTSISSSALDQHQNTDKHEAEVKASAIPRQLPLRTVPHSAKPLINHAPARRLSAIEKSAALEARANEKFNSKDYLVAGALYQQCLQQQEAAYGTKDAHLVPVIARIMVCQMNMHNDANISKYLIRVLKIFSSDREKVRTVVNQLDDSLSVWRPLARASTVVAAQSRGTQRRDYLNWAADFYQLALDSWRSSKSIPEYTRLVEAQKQVVQLSRQESNPQGSKAWTATARTKQEVPRVMQTPLQEQQPLRRFSRRKPHLPGIWTR